MNPTGAKTPTTSPCPSSSAEQVPSNVLRALASLASTITSPHQPDELVEAIAEAACGIMAVDSLSISELIDNGARLRTLINVGQLGSGEDRRPVDETYSLTDFPATKGVLLPHSTRWRTTCVDDPDAEPAEVALLRSLGKTSSLKTPIIIDGHVWGELWAARTDVTRQLCGYDTDVAIVVSGLVSAGLAQASTWARLHAASSTDSLTGLANRRAFDEHLSRHLQQHKVDGGLLALVVADVNGLKGINDSRGHAAGDDALTWVAAAARACTTGVKDALATRLGGDEFVLVLPSLDSSQEALRIANDWCEITASANSGASLACGVALIGPDTTGIDARDLLRAADLAQYEAKRSRSRHAVLAQLRDSAHRDPPMEGLHC